MGACRADGKCFYRRLEWNFRGLIQWRQTGRWQASPFCSVQDWMAEAEKMEPNDPNAMVVATATPNGHPSVRTVLLKGLDDRGFVFYTNKESRKGKRAGSHPRVGCYSTGSR